MSCITTCIRYRTGPVDVLPLSGLGKGEWLVVVDQGLTSSWKSLYQQKEEDAFVAVDPHNMKRTDMEQGSQFGTSYPPTSGVVGTAQ